MAKPRKLVLGVPVSREKDDSEVRWLMSYSDFMMQLVCLFILLYSVCATDAGKASQIAQSWRDEMGIDPIRATSDSIRDSSIPLTLELLPATPAPAGPLSTCRPTRRSTAG